MEKSELKELAEYSKFTFSKEEFEQAYKKICEIVKEISKLDAVPPPDDVDVFNNVVCITDLRGDVVKPSNVIEEVLKNAPKTRGRYFVVPQVRD